MALQLAIFRVQKVTGVPSVIIVFTGGRRYIQVDVAPSAASAQVTR